MITKLLGACTCCEYELDDEGLEVADAREGYSGCCNDRVEYYVERNRPAWVKIDFDED